MQDNSSYNEFSNEQEFLRAFQRGKGRQVDGPSTPWNKARFTTFPCVVQYFITQIKYWQSAIQNIKAELIAAQSKTETMILRVLFSTSLRITLLSCGIWKFKFYHIILNLIKVKEKLAAQNYTPMPPNYLLETGRRIMKLWIENRFRATHHIYALGPQASASRQGESVGWKPKLSPTSHPMRRTRSDSKLHGPSQQRVGKCLIPTSHVKWLISLGLI
jgi:hypothetical protein